MRGRSQQDDWDAWLATFPDPAPTQTASPVAPADADADPDRENEKEEAQCEADAEGDEPFKDDHLEDDQRSISPEDQPVIDEYQSESGCLKDEEAPSARTLCNAVISRVSAAKSKSQPSRPTNSSAESVAGSVAAESNASGRRSVRRSTKAKVDNRDYPCPANADPVKWAT